MMKLFNNFIDTDIGYSFKKSKIAIISTIVFLIIVFIAIYRFMGLSAGLFVFIIIF